MKFYVGSGIKNWELVNYYLKELEKNGWTHTYNWTKYIHGGISATDLIEYAELEQKAIADSDIIIILLPAGRGTHVELGLALALHKMIFLCSDSKEAFYIKNTVNFYELPCIIQLVGTADENIKQILKACKEL